MAQVLKFTTEIEPFTTDEGILCMPIPLQDGGWILPLGWESELQRLGVDYILFDLPEETRPIPDAE
jgi:hypothetical protein